MPQPEKRLTAEQEERFCLEFDICGNPDHNFIRSIGGEICRLGCPTCDGNPDKEITVKPSQIKAHLAQEIEIAVKAYQDELVRQVEKLRTSGTYSEAQAVNETLDEVISHIKDSSL